MTTFTPFPGIGRWIRPLLLLFLFTVSIEAQIARWSFENITSSVPTLPIAPSETDVGVSGQATLAGGTNIGSPEGCFSSETWATNFWPTDAARVTSEYLEFRITADANTTIGVTRFQFESQATSTNSALQYDVYYSTSNFSTEHFLYSGTHTTGTDCRIRSETMDVTVLPGQTLVFRVYPYGQAINAQAASIRLDDVIISGEFLPVELIEFTARREQGAVTLTWTTAGELNNDYFAVERSRDAITFEEIGRLAGAGTSVVAQHYTFMDTSPISGAAYYRLRQVDQDGTPSWHPIVAVQALEIIKTDRIWPTPAKEVVYFAPAEIHQAQEVRLLSAYGQVIRVLICPAGTRQQEVSLQDLPDGWYYLQVGVAGRWRYYQIYKL